MLDAISWTFICAFAGAAVVAVIFSLSKSLIEKKYFTKAKLLEYEKDIDQYNFLYSDDVEKIAEKMHKTIKLELMRKYAYIDDKNPQLIHVNAKLDPERRNFAITHELGHHMRGYSGMVAKNEIKLLSKFIPEEQICDYYSAAILLPRKDIKRMMDDADFHHLSDEDKVNFISGIAIEKCIAEDVVCRRICEITKIYS